MSRAFTLVISCLWAIDYIPCNYCIIVKYHSISRDHWQTPTALLNKSQPQAGLTRPSAFRRPLESLVNDAWLDSRQKAKGANQHACHDRDTVRSVLYDSVILLVKNRFVIGFLNRRYYQKYKGEISVGTYQDNTYHILVYEYAKRVAAETETEETAQSPQENTGRKQTLSKSKSKKGRKEKKNKDLSLIHI